MQKLKLFATLTGIATMTALTACANTPAQKAEEPMVGMANPASVYCAKMGGKTIIKKDAQGNEVGYCQLANGKVVEEWDFYRQNNK